MKTRILQVLWVGLLVIIAYFSGVYVASFILLYDDFIWLMGILQGLANVWILCVLIYVVTNIIGYIKYENTSTYTEVVFNVIGRLPVWYAERKQEKLEEQRKELEELDRLLEEEGVIK